MKKMFVAFGIAIAVFCGMIFGTSQTAQAAEVDTDVAIETRFKAALDYAIDDYSDEYAEKGITNVDATVYSIALPENRVMFMIITTADYQGETIYDVQVETFDRSVVDQGLASAGF